jgi:hypothetical protein
LWVKGSTRYVSSEEFSDTVVASYRESIAVLDGQLADLSEAISEQRAVAASLSQIPVIIGSDGLTVFSRDGSQFRIEMGVAKSGDKVVFQHPYKSEPTVFLGIYSNMLDSISLHRLQSKGTAVLALNASVSGFEVPQSLSPIIFRWVALGQQ